MRRWIRRRAGLLLVAGPIVAIGAAAIRWQVEHPVAAVAFTVVAALGALGPVALLLTWRAPDDQGGDQ